MQTDHRESNPHIAMVQRCVTVIEETPTVIRSLGTRANIDLRSQRHRRLSTLLLSAAVPPLISPQLVPEAL